MPVADFGPVKSGGHFIGTPPSRYVCLPLAAHSDTLGVLYIQCGSEQAASLVERNLDPLSALLQLASMTIAGLNLRGKLENQSIRDSLTGLFNRRFMEIALERELRRASRKQASLAVFMIDADHFKQFNDTFGHKAGDTVLREIADRFLSTVRGEDVVCRYGGEEFIIILPDIGAEKAVQRAESIRESVAALRLADHGQSLGPVTISIGVAVYPGDGRDMEQILQAADRRLYAAKNNGRNQVVFAGQAAQMPIAAR
jgi:diguanylate cyclase (GGDEF)-like protein